MRKRTPQGRSALGRRVTLEGLEDRSLLSASHLALHETHFSPPHLAAEHRAEDHDSDHGHGFGNGIGQFVKAWVHEGIHGRDLAALIHEFHRQDKGDDHGPKPGKGDLGGDDSEGGGSGVGNPGSGGSAGGNPGSPGQGSGAVPPATPPTSSDAEDPPSQTPAGGPSGRGARPPASAPAVGEASTNADAAVVNLPSGSPQGRVLLVGASTASAVPLLPASEPTGGVHGENALAVPGLHAAGGEGMNLGPIGIGVNGLLLGAGPALQALVEFAPSFVGGAADLLPTFALADAEPDGVIAQLIDWSSSDGVREWFPWLSGAAMAAAAFELARRQVRRSGKRTVALPYSEFATAGWPAQDSP